MSKNKSFNIYLFLFLLIFTSSCNAQNQTSLSNDNAQGQQSASLTNSEEQSINSMYAPDHVKRELAKTNINNTVRCGLMDREGNLWFGTTHEGIYRYDGSSKTSEEARFTNISERDGLCNNYINAIIEDSDGILWFATADGLCRYDPLVSLKSGEKALTHITIPRNAVNDSPTDFTKPMQVMCLMQDKNGIIWLGTDGSGAYSYDPSAVHRIDGKAFTNYLQNLGKKQSDSTYNNMIKSITEDNAGNIWFTSLTHGGVSRYDGEVFTHFTKKDGIYDDMVYASFQDSKGSIWFGSIQNHGGGLYRYDVESQNSKQTSFTHFTKEDGLCDNFVTGFFEDSKGLLWICTGVGLCLYDPSVLSSSGEKPLKPFTTNDGKELDGISFVIEDKEGNIWLGGKRSSLWRYNGKELTDFAQKGR